MRGTFSRTHRKHPGRIVGIRALGILALGGLAAQGWAQPLSPLIPGITHVSETEVFLCLEAPNKGKAHVVGDFNAWNPSATPMTKEGDKFWARIGGLTPGKEYAFQYWVDDGIKVGDPYALKVVDFHADPEIIRDGVYPGLLAYNRQFDGPASVFKAGMPPPPPASPTFQKHPYQSLLIYEVHLRDFVKSHSFRELRDSLAYFKRLGVNALQLMPVIEFETNDSWGYNPSYFFALDKYYGPPEEFRALVDEAHRQGLAIILDLVLNHAMGLNPMVRMYWNGATGQPSAESPWFNVTARHPFSVGYDFNWESAYTRNYFKRALQHWIREFKVDGYRIDLSKGLTQKYTFGDVPAWNALDPARVATLTELLETIQAVDPQSYVILEHFGSNEEEKVLASKGFLLQGNSSYDHGFAVQGDIAKDFDWAYSGNRTWADRRLVSYMESHDEERVMAKALAHGLSNGSYSAKDFATAIERTKAAALFLFGIPGPKMLWQHGEWGDDRERGTTDAVRMGRKPMPDAWRADPVRRRLWGAFSGLLHFRQRYEAAFREGLFQWVPDGAVRSWKINHTTVKAFAVANFGLTAARATLEAGTWYDYFSRERVTLTAAGELPLKPGEFHLFVDREAFAAEPDLSAFTVPASLNPVKVTVGIKAAERPRAIRGYQGIRKIRMGSPWVPDPRGVLRDMSGKRQGVVAPPQ